jgi:hypothetical protein
MSRSQSGLRLSKNDCSFTVFQLDIVQHWAIEWVIAEQ